MNHSPETSPETRRARRLTLWTAPPVAVLAVAAYAFSGLHAAADAGHVPVSAAPAPPAIHSAPPPSATSPEETPILREHDAELLAYRTYGG